MYNINNVRMAKGLHLAHLNIQSLFNKWEIFKAQFMSSNLHFIGLSETWLTKKIPDNLLHLSNEYTIIRNDRAWSENNASEPKKGGGIAVFVKNGCFYTGGCPLKKTGAVIVPVGSARLTPGGPDRNNDCAGLER